MKRYIFLTMAMIAVLGLGNIANAAVTFEPAAGTGFVGKGDVQLAFNWNNAALQKNAATIAFNYVTSDSYEAVCEWTTAEGKKGQQTHDVTHRIKTGVDAAVNFDARVKTQITGFILKGFGPYEETGKVPVVGGACPGNEGTDGVWISVTQTDTSLGGLFVTNGISNVSIWSPADPAL